MSIKNQSKNHFYLKNQHLIFIYKAGNNIFFFSYNISFTFFSIMNIFIAMEPTNEL